MNKYIDHTLLKAVATKSDIKILCEEAVKFDFASVCVNPSNVKISYELLKDSNVKVCTVIGFPLGANTIESKVFETKNAIENGAQEIDMVINIGALKEMDLKYLERELSEIKSVCGESVLLKVIIETCYLNEEEKVAISKLVGKLNIDFIKTSTGFGTGGATFEDVKIMKDNIGENTKIKASGGVSDFETAKAYIDLGCERIGTSNGIKIVTKDKTMELNSY